MKASNFGKKSLIGASLLTAVLCGCAVNTGDIEQAQKVCKEHGGVKFLYAFPNKEVFCNDGLVAQNWKDA